MKKKIYQAWTFIAIAALTACNDWLDVQPKDKMLEDRQFSTKENIYSATNGLYRELVGEHLYGGQLTQTTIETMGHFYTYPPSEPATGNLTRPFYYLANFSYGPDEVKGKFSNIWKTAYAALLHINFYIKNVEESTVVMPEWEKKVLLGEAYGLRAYLHFDVFRMFGPVYNKRNGDKALPYSWRTEIVPNHPDYEESEYSTADEYIALLLKDIEKAETLLDGNDPIQTESDMVTEELHDDNFFQNRNRRMNYYALKGLEARVRQYIGDHTAAAAAAKIVTDRIGQVFKWTSAPNVIRYRDYQLFTEVIFGINNPDSYSHAVDWYYGADMQKSYLVDYNNLMDNILGYGGSSILSEILDVRSKQWTISDAASDAVSYSSNGTYKSNRYNKVTFVGREACNDFQPLIRLSEMYYIQAEAALKTGGDAVSLLNEVLQHRGLTTQYFLTAGIPETEIRAHIEKEYYREFFGEGQVFFYHKRLNSAWMFSGNGSGYVYIYTSGDSYVVPIPEDEKNI